MKLIGIVLVGLGILALIYGGITYNKSNTVLEMGSMNITATEKKNIPIPAILGVTVLLGGVGLLVYGSRRGRASL
jgi:hypothetical protein